jgi:hypothetical protein
MWRIARWCSSSRSDRALVQQFAQRSVVDVGEGVVGHQPLADDAVAQVEVQRASGERGRGHGRGGLVVVDHRVGEPACVIDDRVHVLPADPARTSLAVAGELVAGLLEAAQLLDVHVQQLAWAGPQIAHDGGALGGRREQPARCRTR